MLPATIANNAYKLLHKNNDITTTIAETKQAVATEMVTLSKWTAEKLVDEAEINLKGSRDDHSWSPANKALEIIGRVTGTLQERPTVSEVRITKVTVVLSGVGGDAGGVVEAESYEVLEESC